MPISLHIDDIHRRLYTRAEGLVTYAEMSAHIHTRLSPEAATYGELFDCSGATTNVTADEIRQLAMERQMVNEQQQQQQQQQPGPVAIVATDNVFFGMFRMFDVLTERIRPLRVFRDKGQAVQWLDAVADSPDTA
jgi:hypothetical protein